MRQIWIICAVTMVAVACSGNGQGLKDGRSEYKPEANKVEVMTLKKTDFARQLLSNGKLVAGEKASLVFTTSGVIAEVNGTNGVRVSKGERIASLETSSLELAVSSAEIALEKAELDLYDVLAGLGYAAGDTISVPANILSMAKMRSGYSAAQNTLEKARLDLEGAEIRAPFSGKIADVAAARYDMSPSGAFCTIVDDMYFDVDFSVMESEYSFLSIGLPVRVTPFAYPDMEIAGKVTAINPVVDVNGQISVRARIRNNGSLIDGMNVKVMVEKMMPGQFVVPKSAVVVRDYMDVLFTYTDDGKAHWVYVKILYSNSDSHVVVANEDRSSVLNEGDRVIISGNLNLADGSAAELK